MSQELTQNNPCRNGFINVYKPQDMTSHDVVAIIRKRLPRKTKVGHTGTLDPDATGVLPICVGKATRLAEYFHLLPKTYVGQLTLGAVTDTQDSSGNILETAAREKLAKLSVTDLERAVLPFVGAIQQIPPMVSAVKINGRKLYELAREGKTVERPPRNVTICSIEIMDSNFALPQPKATLKVVCSSGTYIRTLCHDIGQALGVGGFMSGLERQAVGGFDIATALDLAAVKERLEQGDQSFFLPMEAAVTHLTEYVLADEQQLADASHGRYIKCSGGQDLLSLCKVTYEGKIVGIGEIKPMHWQDGAWQVAEAEGDNALPTTKMLKINKMLL